MHVVSHDPRKPAQLVGKLPEAPGFVSNAPSPKPQLFFADGVIQAVIIELDRRCDDETLDAFAFPMALIGIKEVRSPFLQSGWRYLLVAFCGNDQYGDMLGREAFNIGTELLDAAGSLQISLRNFGFPLCDIDTDELEILVQHFVERQISGSGVRWRDLREVCHGDTLDVWL
ncbi:hypothetical protein [Ensifer aridi]|uniref:hypothetical protein n=1 Tax=Ensifer aridi TaxID=1708715 RepID=UPI00111C3204|nr:hypothetical protein [Ensifer aridi]